MYIVMVVESSRTYKVFFNYKDLYVYYVVYNNITGSSENFLSDFFIDYGRILNCTAVCHQYVIFDGCYSRCNNYLFGQRYGSEDYIC